MSEVKTNQHRRRMRQAPHKFLEMALVADNLAISAYGEDGIKTHLLMISHIVRFLLIIFYYDYYYSINNWYDFIHVF